MKAVTELNKFLPRLYIGHTMSRQDVHYIMGKVREILEINEDFKQKYPALVLFCDWCFHSELSRSKIVYNYLIKINNAFGEALGKGSTQEEQVNYEKQLISSCANILDIPKCRVGLRLILEKHGLNPRIASEKTWWEGFFQLLLKEISGKPLKIPDEVISGKVTTGSAYKAFKKIMDIPVNISNPQNAKIISIEVLPDDKAKVYNVHLKTISNTTIVFNLSGKEPDSAFITPNAEGTIVKVKIIQIRATKEQKAA